MEVRGVRVSCEKLLHYADQLKVNLTYKYLYSLSESSRYVCLPVGLLMTNRARYPKLKPVLTRSEFTHLCNHSNYPHTYSHAHTWTSGSWPLFLHQQHHATSASKHSLFIFSSEFSF